MYLFKYILKRLGLMLLTLVIIVTLCFVLVKMLPNKADPGVGKDAALIELRREMMGYDKPIMEQYVYYIFGRTSYTYTVKDAEGNPVQATDDKGNPDYEKTPKLDENGDYIYVKDDEGNYLNAYGQVTTNPRYYVYEYEYKLDASGNKIPLYQTQTVFEKSKLPSYVGKDYVTAGTGGIIRGFFGASEILIKGADAWQMFAEKLPFTVALNLYSILLSIPLGIALGIYAALRKNKWQDHVISVGVMIFVSVPSFIYAFLVQYILYYKLGWVSALVDAKHGAWSPQFFATAIPAILSMSFGTIAGFARYTRAELTEVLTSEFMLLARTKGLTKGQAVVRHALKNAMVVIFPMILGEFISIMSGSLIIEGIFSIPGVGSLYINSINAQPNPDYNVFLLLSGFYTIIGLLAGIVIDVSYGIIDPRIRMGAR